jgi:linoleate 10R-lipoxygenase
MLSVIQDISFRSDKLHLSQRDPPIAPDGLYDWQAGEDVDDSPEANSFLTNVFRVVGMITKKNRNAPNPRHIVSLARNNWSLPFSLLVVSIRPAS